MIETTHSLEDSSVNANSPILWTLVCTSYTLCQVLPGDARYWYAYCGTSYPLTKQLPATANNNRPRGLSGVDSVLGSLFLLWRWLFLSLQRNTFVGASSALEPARLILCFDVLTYAWCLDCRGSIIWPGNSSSPRQTIGVIALQVSQWYYFNTWWLWLIDVELIHVGPGYRRWVLHWGGATCLKYSRLPLYGGLLFIYNGSG